MWLTGARLPRAQMPPKFSLSVPVNHARLWRGNILKTSNAGQRPADGRPAGAQPCYCVSTLIAVPSHSIEDQQFVMRLVP
jgi:hypothetical protein